MSFTRRLFFTSLAVPAGAFALGRLFPPVAQAEPRKSEAWAKKLIDAARTQIGVTLIYDPNYTKIEYPRGDVARMYGVCTDVVIRAYRDGLDLDLQRLVHEDMRQAFSVYPKIWGLKRPDTNIDHRRVPNLATYFKRRKSSLPVSNIGLDYRPGDLITQVVGGSRPHILVISDRLNDAGTRPLAIHNIGLGAQEGDVIFDYPITGHYRFSGKA